MSSVNETNEHYHTRRFDEENNPQLKKKLDAIAHNMSMANGPVRKGEYAPEEESVIDKGEPGQEEMEEEERQNYKDEEERKDEEEQNDEAYGVLHGIPGLAKLVGHEHKPEEEEKPEGPPERPDHDTQIGEFVKGQYMTKKGEINSDA